METSDRIVKGKPTAGTNGEVEKPARPTKGQECQHEGRKKVMRKKEEESESGGVIGREVGANWRVVQLSDMFLFFKLEFTGEQKQKFALN